MKTLVVVECKNCGMKVAGEDVPAMKRGENIDVILKAIGRCAACKQVSDRTAGGKRTRPGDFAPGKPR